MYLQMIVGLRDSTCACLVDECSQSVFGVSAESMQCSYDQNGNSVPTILLLMQERLYNQGGLKVCRLNILAPAVFSLIVYLARQNIV